MRVLGRLSEGSSPEAAQAELSAFGRPDPGDSPEADTRLLPEVVPFGMSFTSLPRGGLTSLPEFIYFQFLAWVLLMVACGNVAMLIFARTATRFRELAIRTALGAGRIRIVWQLFVETLILSLLAAGLGVFATNWVLGRINLGALAGEAVLPYWFSLGLTGSTLLWALALAVVSATVAGVIPAVRITGDRIQESIKRAEAGRSGIRFGGVTGALVVADVAIAVAAIGFALALVTRVMDRPTAEVLAGIPAEEYLAVEVRMPSGEARGGGEEERRRTTRRQAAIQSALVERLLAEPEVRSVAVADALPRMDPRARAFEVEGLETFPDSRGRFVRTVRVDVDFFDALGQTILTGRDFNHGDLEVEAPGIIVNTVFADQELGGGDPLGRRIRFTTRSGGDEAAWHPIVGVVGHLGTDMVNPEGGPAIYLPAPPGTLDPAEFGIHVGPSPERLAPRLREIAAAVDPNLILGTPVVLSEIYQGDWYVMLGVAGGLTLLVGVLVALAISGIYAMMSFSVSERTREIGIRAALGASKRVLVATILRRTVVQLALGAILGAALAGRLFFQVGSTSGGARSPLLAFLMALGLAVAIVVFIGLVSCLVPTRRIVKVEASEALRAEG